MPGTCILTDSMIQFLNPEFPGHEWVYTLQMQVRLGDISYPDTKNEKLYPEIFSPTHGMMPQLQAPHPTYIADTLITLGQQYHSIIAILTSARISPVISALQETLGQLHGSITIQIIDSETTGIGLGILVQEAAAALLQGNPVLKVSHLVRSFLPHIYTVFCLQNLSYLANAGLLDPAQALAGEVMGMIPFYLIENGRLAPIQKARNPRQMVDMLDEFVSEFELVKHIAIMQGYPPLGQEVRSFRERLSEKLSKACFSEHAFGPGLMSLVGPRSLSVVVVESYEPYE